MAGQESGLHDHLGYWLRRLSDQVHTSFERQLARFDVTVAQWNVLVTLHHGLARTTSEVARYIETDQGAVSRLVDRLADKGLVTRQPDPASRRQQLLVLTPEALTLIPQLIAAADQNDHEYFGSMPEPDRDSLSALLKSLLKPPSTKE